MRSSPEYEDPNDVPRLYYRRRLDDRLIAELLGICRGVIADGVVNAPEAEALMQWVRNHPDVAFTFPGNKIVERLQHVFADGVICEEEQEALRELLSAVVGDPQPEDRLDRPTTVLFDDPLPTLFFDGYEYAFTGTFAYGTRQTCAQAVLDRGGRVARTLKRTTNVLVVGTFGTQSWIESPYGLKLQAAAERRADGRPLAVVPEEHWVVALGDA